MKEEEGADGDSHDQTGLSGQELSKFALCFVPLVHNINIYYLCSSIHINCIPGDSQYHQACERTLDLKKVFIPSLWTTQFLGTSHFSNMLCFFFCNIFINLLFLHCKQGSVSSYLPKLSVQIL